MPKVPMSLPPTWARVFDLLTCGKGLGRQQRGVERPLDVGLIQHGRRDAHVALRKHGKRLAGDETIGPEDADFTVAGIEPTDEVSPAPVGGDARDLVVDRIADALLPVVAQVLVHEIAGQDHDLPAREGRADVLGEKQIDRRAMHVEVAPVLAQPDGRADRACDGSARAHDR